MYVTTLSPYLILLPASALIPLIMQSTGIFLSVYNGAVDIIGHCFGILTSERDKQGKLRVTSSEVQYRECGLTRCDGAYLT